LENGFGVYYDLWSVLAFEPAFFGNYSGVFLFFCGIDNEECAVDGCDFDFRIFCDFEVGMFGSGLYAAVFDFDDAGGVAVDEYFAGFSDHVA